MRCGHGPRSVADRGNSNSGHEWLEWGVSAEGTQVQSASALFAAEHIHLGNDCEKRHQRDRRQDHRQSEICLLLLRGHGGLRQLTVWIMKSVPADTVASRDHLAALTLMVPML